MCRSRLGCSLFWRDISFDLEVLFERSYALGHAEKDLLFDRAEQAGAEEQQKQAAPRGKASQESASQAEPAASPARGKALQHTSRAGLVTVTQFSQESRSSDKTMVMRQV